MTAHPSRLATEAFEAQRDRLRAVAYRVLSSHADAEDVVQEAWMRLVRQDAATIGNLGMPTFAQIAIRTSDDHLLLPVRAEDGREVAAAK